MSDANYRYVIVGGGVAADKAARAIVATDPDGTVAILTETEDGPVYRPALSKDAWDDEDATLAKEMLDTAKDTGGRVIVERAVGVRSIDVASRKITTTRDVEITYEVLLLATGSRPREFEYVDRGVDSSRVIYFREPDDFRRLHELAERGLHIAVVGGGYIGTELSAALTKTPAKVSFCFRGNSVSEGMFPPSISNKLDQVYSDKGVTLVPGFALARVEAGEGGRPKLVPDEGEAVEVDAVVLALGAVPNVELARQMGVSLVDGAVQVDRYLRTDDAHVFAAGDIVRFDDPLFGPRRVEHIDNAERSGTVAGTNMAGGSEEYDHTPSFFSDLFDDGYEAVGYLDSSKEMVEVWNDDDSAAVVYYLSGGTVEGILLWNTWDSVPKAREVLRKSRDGEIDTTQLRDAITPGG